MSLIYEQLCAQQALQIANLTARVKAMNEAMRKIHMVIYCVGGPLNDNKLGYSRQQMEPFSRIAAQADGWGGMADDEGEGVVAVEPKHASAPVKAVVDGEELRAWDRFMG